MIFLDFDGTMVDIWPRYYTVFCDLCNIKGLSIDDYKKIKLKLKRDEEVAKAIGTTLPKNYFEDKASCLENIKYLMLDKLLVSSREINELKKRKAIILSKRRKPDNLKRQLELLGVDLPCNIVCGDQSKIDWVMKNYKGVNGIIIGDSTEDLRVGNLKYVQPLMVSSGLDTVMDFDHLQIDYLLFENLKSVVKYLIEVRL